MRVAEYLAYWQNLTPKNIGALRDIAAPDFRFVDPFNDHTGYAAVEAMLEKMFTHLPNAKFTVKDTATSGQVVYVRWHFFARAGWEVEGMSEVHFGPDGRATLHLDHWDAASQFYERLPLLGAVLRAIKRRV
jgi:steroid Delta-isomerase